MACDRIAGAHKLYFAPHGKTTGGVTYIGATGPEGINLVREYQLQEIQSDLLGPSAVVDHVYQGANMYLEFVVQAVNKDVVQQMLHPFQNTFSSSVATAVAQEHFGVAGRLGCQVYGILEAIPVPFSPASDFTGGSATGGVSDYPTTPASTPSGRQFKGIVVGTLTESLDSRARFIPIRFQCYPWYDSDNGDGALVHWKWVTTNSTTLASGDWGDIGE